jgi:hypothetical protein
MVRMGSPVRPLGPRQGHIRATNDRIAADNSGQHQPPFTQLAGHTPHFPQVAAIPQRSLTRKRTHCYCAVRGLPTRAMVRRTGLASPQARCHQGPLTA